MCLTTSAPASTSTTGCVATTSAASTPVKSAMLHQRGNKIVNVHDFDNEIDVDNFDVDNFKPHHEVEEVVSVATTADESRPTTPTSTCIDVDDLNSTMWSTTCVDVDDLSSSAVGHNDNDVPLRPRRVKAMSVPVTQLEHAKLKKSVSFGHLEELSFAVVAGDPKIELAYPMQLGWDVVRESSVSVDEYEEARIPHRAKCSDDLRTLSEERRKIIKASQKELVKSKKARRNSIANGMIGRDKRRNSVQAFLKNMFQC